MSAISFNTSDYQPYGGTPAAEVLHGDPEVEFKAVMIAYGLNPPHIIQVGDLARVPTLDKPRDKNGWYVFFSADSVSGIAGGVFGDWCLGDERQV